MSRLSWSEDAERDLDDITDYIARDDVIAAVRMRDEIERRIEVLSDHPMAGRMGCVRGTRELVLAGTPYIGVYRVRDDNVLILRVLARGSAMVSNRGITGRSSAVRPP